MSYALKCIQELITSRRRWEDGVRNLVGSDNPEYGDYANWVAKLLCDIGDEDVGCENNFRPIAVLTGALPLLAKTWEVFKDQAGSGGSERRSLTVASLMRLVDGLTAPAERFMPKSDEDVTFMLTKFSEGAALLLNTYLSPENNLTGFVPVAQMSEESELLRDRPEYVMELGLLSLEQKREEMMGMAKVIGRQTGEKSWSEWFAEKCQSAFEEIPSACRAVIQAIAGRAIGHILGTSFGSNLLAPWTAAFIDFPNFYGKQLGLYRIKEYGEKKVGAHGRVVGVLNNSIERIDWEAIRYAFQVTPFGIFVTAYAVARKLSELVRLKKPDCTEDARVLIELADAENQGDESVIAQLVILFFAEDDATFMIIMTAKISDAVDALAKKMRG
ncbi:MAG: hypothetical protein QOI13_1747 [Paraburkholderia sp.]|jgi:hypothetical protein|nr:hypothetical protein [Paraburkholderia sp.]